MSLRVLLLGEGKSEEGERNGPSAQPGKPIQEASLGAAHVLVPRVVVEVLKEPVPTFVVAPRLRQSPRTGNPGLIKDLEGAPRIAANPRQKGWLERCVGDTSVDLVVLLKDCKVDGRECGVDKVVSELGSAIAGRLPHGGTQVVRAAAKPSLEGWLLESPESEEIGEKRAKALWAERGYDPGDVSSMAGAAWNLDLANLEAVCPEGFGRLVKDLREAVHACKVTSKA